MSTASLAAHHHAPLKGIALKLGAVFCFGLMALCIKLLSGAYPLSEIVFSRNLFAVIPLSPLVMRAGWTGIAPNRPVQHLWRGLVGVTAMAMTFYTIRHLPLAISTTLQFTVPLFAAVLAAVFLGEKLHGARILAVVLGFVGVLLVLHPEAGFPVSVALVGLGASGLVGVVTLLLRQMTATETSLTIVVWFTVICIIVSGVVLPFEFLVPNRHDAALFVAMGLCGGVAQILFTHAYRYAPVSLLVIFDYTALLWASLYGYLFWQEMPGGLEACGAALIIGSGLYVARHGLNHGLAHDRRSTHPRKTDRS